MNTNQKRTLSLQTRIDAGDVERETPAIDRVTDRIAADCRAGLLTREEALEAVIAANMALAEAYLTPRQQRELEVYLRATAAELGL